MQTITINRKEYRISADMERVLRTNRLAAVGWATMDWFDSGRGRHRSNHAIKAFGCFNGIAHKRGFGDELGVTILYATDAPEAARKAHPRAKRFVVVTNRRRFNLVRQKVGAAQ